MPEAVLDTRKIQEGLLRSLMFEQEIRQKHLVARWGKTAAFVSHLIGGHTRALALELDLAALLGVAVGRIFPPHRYDQKYGISRDLEASPPTADLIQRVATAEAEQTG